MRDIVKERLRDIARYSKCVSQDLLSWLSDNIQYASIVSRKQSLAPMGTMVLGYLAEIERAQDRKRVQDALKYLERKRLIRIEKGARTAMITLTNKGETAALKHRVKQEDRLLPQGMYTVVVFDVPEHVREVRDRFRSLLKSSGFQKMQRSVWCSEKDLVKTIGLVITTLKLHKWVTVFEGRGIDR
ncbi:MAG: Repressor in ring oxydation complex/ phenylacetic acid degradation pathway related protein (PaaX) [Parcubacteria group bacterium GW2011_GWA2_56_7]|nr:MAG: Repressor in ring oxydation complex/ phenylacetic acid degradation pathway related protein (PaaX) [Parcubacteria group bacterium GW2011_GWA2_56_7]